MARESRGQNDPDLDDPDAIRAAMAETRAALDRKLEALGERLLGSAPAALNQGERTMAVKKKATKPAKKSGAVAKSKKAKKAAPAKKAASRKTAAKGKTAVAKMTSKVKPKKKLAAKPAAKKKTTVAKVVAKTKEVAGDILAGAAAGAMAGAAQAAAATIPPPAPEPAPAPFRSPHRNETIRIPTGAIHKRFLMEQIPRGRWASPADPVRIRGRFGQST